MMSLLHRVEVNTISLVIHLLVVALFCRDTVSHHLQCDSMPPCNQDHGTDTQVCGTLMATTRIVRYRGVATVGPGRAGSMCDRVCMHFRTTM